MQTINGIKALEQSDILHTCPSYQRTKCGETLAKDAAKLLRRLARLDRDFKARFLVSECGGELLSLCGKYRFNPMFFGLRPDKLTPGQIVGIQPEVAYSWEV